MKAGEIINGRLVADTAVAAIVSTRVQPVTVPQEVDLPAAAYQVSITDPSEGTAPLQRCSVTVHCLAHDDTTANTLAIAVDAALNGYAARNGGTYMRTLERVGWDEFRDPEQNVWGRTLSYQTWITF